jgi:anthranilate 1,2-dioxygenase small subunit
MTAQAKQACADLLAEYAYLIDADRLEDWLDLFVEDATYQIVPRENYVRGLPLQLMLCENKNMLRDRVVSLRQANIYNIHVDRHLVSAVRYQGEENGLHSVGANYAVFQTDQDGQSRLFSVGEYIDTLVVEDGVFKFKDKLVIADTASIPTLLATPL